MEPMPDTATKTSENFKDCIRKSTSQLCVCTLGSFMKGLFLNSLVGNVLKCHNMYLQTQVKCLEVSITNNVYLC